MKAGLLRLEKQRNVLIYIIYIIYICIYTPHDMQEPYFPNLSKVFPLVIHEAQSNHFRSIYVRQKYN